MSRLDKYAILHPLEGGKGVRVYACREQGVEGSRLVLTLTSKRLCSRESASLLRARVGLSLPHLVRVSDVAFRGKRLGVVSRHISEAYSPGSLERLPDAERFACELGCLLRELHRAGLFLGVIKRHQIFVREDGNWIANFLGPYSLFANTYRGRGFLSCASPEFLESRTETAAADCYSFGLLLYELFSGHPAFTAVTAADLAHKQKVARPRRPRKVNPDISRRIEQVIMDLLEKRVSARAGLDYAVRALDPSGVIEASSQIHEGLMVGRSEEMRGFAQVLQAYLDKPEFRFVCLSGPCGVGKTRLARELELMARLAGCRSLTVRHLREGRPAPLFRLLSPVLPGATGESGPLSDVPSMGRRLRGPLIVRSEDLHWVDECDVELYKQLQVLKCPVLVVATAQKSLSSPSWKKLQNWLSLSDGMVWIRLRGLRPGPAATLVKSAWPDVTEPQVRALVRSTAGNPLLLIEAIRHGQPSGFSGPPVDETDGFLGRIAAMPTMTRRILNTLAFVQGVVTDRFLAESVGTNERVVGRALEELQDLDVVSRPGQENGSESQISHDFYRAAIAGSLGSDEARAIHSRLATSFESELLRSGNQALLEEVTRHWLRCGCRDRALVHLHGAVRGLIEARLPRRAAYLLEEAFRAGAVTSHDWASVKQLIQMLYDCGEYRRLAALAEEISGSLDDGDEERKVLLLLFVARVKKLMGDREGAAETCRQALGLAPVGRRSFRRQLETILMIVQAQSGRRGESRRLFKKLQPEITPSLPEKHSIHSACALFLLESEGRVRAARHHALQSLLPLQEGHLMPALGRVCSLATCHLAMGRLRRADALLAYVLAQSRSLANPELMSLAALNRNTSFRRLGRIRRLGENLDWISRSDILANRDYRAENHLQRAKYRLSTLDLRIAQQEIKKARGGTFWTSLKAGVCRAWMLTLQGDPQGALDLLSGPPPFNRLVRGQRLLARAQAFLQLEKLSDARQAGAEALSIFSDNMIYHEVKARQQMALVCQGEGNHAGALDHLNASLEIARKECYDALLGRGFVLAGRSLAFLGELRRGRVSVARGLQILNRVQRPGLRVEAEVCMGQILDALGRRETARLCFVRALQIVREKSLHLRERDRRGFDRLWIEPVERELSRVQPTARVVESRIQIVERFAARTRTCRNTEELSEAVLDAVTAGVDCRSAMIVRRAVNGRDRVIASRCRPDTQPGLPESGVLDDQFRLEESLTLHGVGSLFLLVEGGSGGFVESEYDLIKCLVRVVEGQALDWSGGQPSVSGEAGAGGFELSDGRCLVGDHPLMRRLFDLIRKVGPTTATVLISGESGTGKELVARALHESSGRSENPWIAVNCAALPAELLESELFGHSKGSFTGAEMNQAGLIEAAHTGTLFLDEIASMPIGHQTRLLRVLQERRVRRLGETGERHVDVRFIAASNESLEPLVASGKFREDLFHRLNVIRIRVPALRERTSDIPALVHHFLGRLSEEHGEIKDASENFLRQLQRLSLRGNVRELRNLLEQTYLLTPRSRLRSGDLPGEEKGPAGESRGDGLSRQLFEDLVHGRVDFWEDVRARFLKRDLSRPEIRGLIALGLESTEGSYRRLVRRFHLPATDYRRFLSFLSHHDCKVDFRPFRIPPPVS